MLGTLVAAARRDPKLSAYGAIVVDEAHQHTVPTDILLGLLKGLVTKRDDLKVIIMSATIDAAKFRGFFPGSVVKEVRGRTYPVEVSYLPEPASDSVMAVVDTILQVHLRGEPGDILVFASGTQEIFKIIRLVKQAVDEPGPRRRFAKQEIGPLDYYPLHAQASSDDQDDAVQNAPPHPRNGHDGRKLIVATNIAETSITLTGITHVIDSCRVKSKIWNPRDESWSLRELWVSKAVARQRAGRAGRTRQGSAWRMCTETGFMEQLAEHSVPAIQESDMLSECLDILQMGLDPLSFPFMEPPAAETVAKALGLLQEFGAVDAKCALVQPYGGALAKLPVDIYSAAVLLASPKYGCSDEMLSLVSMIEATEGGSHLFVKATTKEEQKLIEAARRRWQHPTGDHLTLFNIYMKYREACEDDISDEFARNNWLHLSVLKAADRIRDQLLGRLEDHPGWVMRCLDWDDMDYYVCMLQALAAGNFLRVAKRMPGFGQHKYQTVRHGIEVELLKSTDLGPPSDLNEYVIYNEHHNGDRRRTIRLVSAISPRDLVAAAPWYWYDAEFATTGHIRDDLVKLVAGLTVKSEGFVQGAMPGPTTATSTQ